MEKYEKDAQRGRVGTWLKEQSSTLNLEFGKLILELTVRITLIEQLDGMHLMIKHDNLRNKEKPFIKTRVECYCTAIRGAKMKKTEKCQMLAWTCGAWDSHRLLAKYTKV